MWYCNSVNRYELTFMLLLLRKGCVTYERGSFLVDKMQDFAVKLYKSKAWKKCRESYASSVDGLCERCLARGFYTPGEIVHHKIYINSNNVSDPSVTLNFDNLELLCRVCHANEHKTNAKRFSVDELGRVKAE